MTQSILGSVGASIMPTGIAALIESVGAVVMENVVDPVASAPLATRSHEDDGYDLAEEIAPYLTFKLDRMVV